MKLRDELDECFGCGDLPRVERALARAKKAPRAEQSALFMPLKMLEKYAENLRGTTAAPRARRAPVSLSLEPEPEPEPTARAGTPDSAAAFNAAALRRATSFGPATVRPRSRPNSSGSAQSVSPHKQSAVARISRVDFDRLAPVRPGLLRGTRLTATCPTGQADDPRCLVPAAFRRRQRLRGAR